MRRRARTTELGVGVEPDVRFGGPPLSVDGKVVVFRLRPEAPATTSAEYAGAAATLQLAAAVAHADGGVAPEEAATSPASSTDASATPRSP